MMGAAQRWTIAGLAGLSLLAVAASAGAQLQAPAPKEVTNADRVWRNFTREAATVEAGQFRVEVRAFRVEERSDGGYPDCYGPLRKDCARLNTIGQRVLGVKQVVGGTFELLTSYGIAENAEVGLIIPGYVESIHRWKGNPIDGNTVSRDSAADLGDLTVYGKFTQRIAENCSVGGGLELVFPPWNGLDRKMTTWAGDDLKMRTTPENKIQNGDPGTFTGFSTGELGINPFVSTRYQKGRFGVGGHVGYTFYTGNSVEEVFNYSVHTLARAGDFWGLRLELSGRVWDQFGETWHDLVLMPGIDFHVIEGFAIRPTGLANLTDTAMDWGVGVGVAAVF